MIENCLGEGSWLRSSDQKLTPVRPQPGQEIWDLGVHKILEHTGLAISLSVDLDQTRDLTGGRAKFDETLLKWRSNAEPQFVRKGFGKVELAQSSQDALGDTLTRIGEGAVEIEQYGREAQYLAA